MGNWYGPEDPGRDYDRHQAEAELTEMTANHPVINGCDGEFCDGIHNVCAKCSRNSVPSPNQVAMLARYRRQVELAQAERDRRRNARSHGYYGPLTRNDLAAMAR